MIYAFLALVIAYFSALLYLADDHRFYAPRHSRNVHLPRHARIPLPPLL